MDRQIWGLAAGALGMLGWFALKKLTAGTALLETNPSEEDTAIVLAPHVPQKKAIAILAEQVIASWRIKNETRSIGVDTEDAPLARHLLNAAACLSDEPNRLSLS